jgi:hypothetical protein
MTRLMIDAAILAKLHNLDGLLEVCDETGKVLGYFHPLGRTSRQQVAHSPFSHAELQHRRQQRTGRSLAEIFDQLGKTSSQVEE